MSKGTWYWLAHPLHAWVPVQVLGTSANSLVVRTPAPFAEYFQVDASQLSHVEVHESCLREHAEMQGKFGDGFMELSEASVLHNLRVRFLNDRCFTSVARCLVYVNPFKLVKDGLSEYFAGPRDGHPHIYGLVASCYKNLFVTHRDQAVIVSGNAGSGRSDVVSLALDCLTQVSPGKFEHLLSQARIVLDAFSLASMCGTKSRRCALWIEMLYPPTTNEPRIEMTGCRVSSFLFERTRVVRPGVGERNFDVLYQLWKASAEKSGNLEDFSVLPEEEIKTTDAVDFAATRSALQHLGLAGECKLLFKVLSAILLLSRLKFSSDGATCQIVDSVSLKKCASLMGISHQELEQGLLTQTVVTGDDEVTSFLDSVRKAQASRDSFIQALYAALFEWLLSLINTVLNAPVRSFVHKPSPTEPLVQQLAPPPQRPEGPLTLGILDMVGFERQSNFDHLVANYANEQLHGFFLSHLFTSSQQSYLADGLAVNEEYPSNDLALHLLHEETGLLGLVERDAQQGVSDTMLVGDIAARYRGHRLLKVKKRPKHYFTITHYGGQVRYRIQGFVDRLASCNSRLLNALRRTELQVLDKFFEHKQSTRFDVLLDQLTETDPHFVKCVQPNLRGLPNYFDGVCVLEQLHDLGLCHLIEMQKLGFPVRMSHNAFCSHYHPLFQLPFSLNLFQPDDTASAKAVKFLDSQEFAVASWKVGATLVFLDAELHTTLEEIREAVFAQVIIPLQAIIRGRIARRKFRSLLAMRSLARTLLKEFPPLPKQPSRQAILELRQALKAMRPLEEHQPDLYLRLKKLKHRVRRVQQTNDSLQWAIHFPRGPLNQSPNEPLFKDIPFLQMAIEITKSEYKFVEDKPITLKEAEVKVKDWPAFLSCIPDAIRHRNLTLLRNQVKAAREFRLVDDLPSHFSGLIARLAQEELLLSQLKEPRGDERAAVIACGKAGLSNPDIEAARVRFLESDIEDDEDEPEPDYIVELPPPIPLTYWQAFDVDEPAMTLLVFEAELTTLECRKPALQLRQRIRDKAISQLRKSMELHDMTKIVELVQELTPDAIYLPNLLKEAHLILHPRTEILQQVQRARDTFNDHLLASLFEKAFCVGLELHPTIAAAITWCNDMKELRKLFCVMRVAWAIGEVRLLTMSASRATSAEVGALLREASPLQRETHATLVKLTQDCVRKAHLSQKHRRQREVAQSCRRVKRRDVRPTASDDERYAMHHFPALRDPADFSKSFFAIKKPEKQHMLQFSDQPITKSLTQLQHTKHKKPALQAFKSLLGYMGDGPAEQHPDVVGASILQCALEFPQLGDEILVQLVKQVTMNPNSESTLKGWELLGMAAHVFHPSNLLQPYFLNFLYSTTCDEKAPERVYGYARYVMYKLKYPDMSTNPPLATVSAEALARFRARNMTSDLVRINFPDGTWMQLLAHPWHKASDTLETVSGWLGLEFECKKEEKEFSLFYTQANQSCPIDKDACLLDLPAGTGSSLPRFDFRRRVTHLSSHSGAIMTSVVYHDAVRCLCQHPSLYPEDTRVFVLACHQLLYDRRFFESIGNTSGPFLVDAGGVVAQTRSLLPNFASPEERSAFESKVRLKKLELIGGDTKVDAWAVLEVLQQFPGFAAVRFPCELDTLPVEVGIGPCGVVILGPAGLTHCPLADILHSACTERSFQLNLHPRADKNIQYYFSTTQGPAMHSLMQEYLPIARRNSSRRNSAVPAA